MNRATDKSLASKKAPSDKDILVDTCRETVHGRGPARTDGKCSSYSKRHSSSKVDPSSNIGRNGLRPGQAAPFQTRNKALRDVMVYNKSIQESAEGVNMSHATIRSWHRRALKEGITAAPDGLLSGEPTSGRRNFNGKTPKLPVHMIEFISQDVRLNPNRTLLALVGIIKERFGVDVSQATLSRRKRELLSTGIASMLLDDASEKTEKQDETARESFDMENVICVAENNFRLLSDDKDAIPASLNVLLASGVMTVDPSLPSFARPGLSGGAVDPVKTFSKFLESIGSQANEALKAVPLFVPVVSGEDVSLPADLFSKCQHILVGNASLLPEGTKVSVGSEQMLLEDVSLCMPSAQKHPMKLKDAAQILRRPDCLNILNTSRSDVLTTNRSSEGEVVKTQAIGSGVVVYQMANRNAQSPSSSIHVPPSFVRFSGEWRCLAGDLTEREGGGVGSLSDHLSTGSWGWTADKLTDKNDLRVLSKHLKDGPLRLYYTLTHGFVSSLERNRGKVSKAKGGSSATGSLSELLDSRRVTTSSLLFVDLVSSSGKLEFGLRDKSEVEQRASDTDPSFARRRVIPDQKSESFSKLLSFTRKCMSAGFYSPALRLLEFNNIEPGLHFSDYHTLLPQLITMFADKSKRPSMRRRTHVLTNHMERSVETYSASEFVDFCRGVARIVTETYGPDVALRTRLAFGIPQRKHRVVRYRLHDEVLENTFPFVIADAILLSSDVYNPTSMLFVGPQQRLNKAFKQYGKRNWEVDDIRKVLPKMLDEIEKKDIVKFIQNGNHQITNLSPWHNGEEVIDGWTKKGQILAGAEGAADGLPILSTASKEDGGEAARRGKKKISAPDITFSSARYFIPHGAATPPILVEREDDTFSTFMSGGRSVKEVGNALVAAFVIGGSSKKMLKADSIALALSSAYVSSVPSQSYMQSLFLFVDYVSKSIKQSFSQVTSKNRIGTEAVRHVLSGLEEVATLEKLRKFMFPLQSVSSHNSTSDIIVRRFDTMRYLGVVSANHQKIFEKQCAFLCGLAVYVLQTTKALNQSALASALMSLPSGMDKNAVMNVAQGADILKRSQQRTSDLLDTVARLGKQAMTYVHDGMDFMSFDTSKGVGSNALLGTDNSLARSKTANSIALAASGLEKTLKDGFDRYRASYQEYEHSRSALKSAERTREFLEGIVRLLKLCQVAFRIGEHAEKRIAHATKEFCDRVQNMDAEGDIVRTSHVLLSLSRAVSPSDQFYRDACHMKHPNGHEDISCFDEAGRLMKSAEAGEEEWNTHRPHSPSRKLKNVHQKGALPVFGPKPRRA
jgi:transposase